MLPLADFLTLLITFLDSYSVAAKVIMAISPITVSTYIKVLEEKGKTMNNRSMTFYQYARKYLFIKQRRIGDVVPAPGEGVYYSHQNHSVNSGLAGLSRRRKKCYDCGKFYSKN